MAGHHPDDFQSRCDALKARLLPMLDAEQDTDVVLAVLLDCLVLGVVKGGNGDADTCDELVDEMCDHLAGEVSAMITGLGELGRH